ncbi:MAG: hypothetical protein KTR29_08300 [Rhodothermaceae bacterium]|nr:hypothetical protein [Rhodothermaceae bacterium]
MPLITIEAQFDDEGKITFSEEVGSIDLRGKRVLITVLAANEYEQPISPGQYAALVSQSALARYWDTPEEDEAWAHFQDSESGGD